MYNQYISASHGIIMSKLSKLQTKLQRVETAIQTEIQIMSHGTVYPMIWSDLQRKQAELKKAIFLLEKNKTPFYRIFQKRKERLEIKLAGAIRAQQVEEDMGKKCGVMFPAIVSLLSDEIFCLKKKLNMI